MKKGERGEATESVENASRQSRLPSSYRVVVRKVLASFLPSFIPFWVGELDWEIFHLPSWHSSGARISIPQEPEQEPVYRIYGLASRVEWK